MAGGTNIWLGQPYFLVVVHDAMATKAARKKTACRKWRNLLIICISKKIMNSKNLV